jgi:hypothetical protein
MNAAVSLAAPLIIASVCLWGLMRGTDVFAAMAAGAGKGLAVLRDILPAMLVLFPAVYMLRASGLLDALSALLSPALSALGIPAGNRAHTFSAPLHRQRSPGRRLGHNLVLRARLSARQDRRRNAGLQRDDFLRGVGIFRGRRGEKDPLGHTRGALRRRRRLYQRLPCLQSPVGVAVLVISNKFLG